MADEKRGFSPEELAELKSNLGEIEKNIGTKMADHVKTAVDAALKPVQDEVKGLKDFQVSVTEANTKNQAWIDEQIAKGKTIQVDPNNFSSNLKKSLEENKDKIANYKNDRGAITFEMKAVGNMGSGNFTVSGTPAFMPGGPLSEPGRKGYEIRHIRDLVRVVPLPMGMDTYVIRDAGGEGGPATVAAAAAKQQIDRDYVKTIVPITKIATYWKVPEEYLADITWLQDELTGVGVEELLAKEDTLFLTNSAAGEFKGLNQTLNSTAFSAPASLALAINNANNYDVLVAAWTQLRNTNPSSIPNAVVLHPSDYALMILTKDSQNNYVFGSPNQSIPNIFGAPVIPHTAVTSDKYYLGDFSKVKVGVRAGLTVRFYDQNEDDAIKNMVTIVIEERVTIAADRADRIIYGDFSADAASLETP